MEGCVGQVWVSGLPQAMLDSAEGEIGTHDLSIITSLTATLSRCDELTTCRRWTGASPATYIQTEHRQCDRRCKHQLQPKIYTLPIFGNNFFRNHGVNNFLCSQGFFVSPFRFSSQIIYCGGHRYPQNILTHTSRHYVVPKMTYYVPQCTLNHTRFVLQLRGKVKPTSVYILQQRYSNEKSKWILPYLQNKTRGINSKLYVKSPTPVC